MKKQENHVSKSNKEIHSVFRLLKLTDKSDQEGFVVNERYGQLITSDNKNETVDTDWLKTSHSA